jgi:hypothetical protein
MKTNASEANRATRQSIFADVEALADLVKRVYTLEQRMRESVLTECLSTYTPSPRLDGRAATLETAARKSPWSKIATFLAEQHIGPVDYLVRQFDQSFSLLRPLWANEMLGDTAWQRYSESKAAKPKALAITLHSCRSQLIASARTSNYMVWSPKRVDRNSAVEACLSGLCCQSSFSPLFVYCAAVELERNYPAYSADAAQLSCRYERRAAVEYVRFRPDYDAAWRELIPGGFRARAEGIYREILTRLF